MDKQQHTFDVTPLVAAITAAVESTATAGQQARLLADMVKAAVKGKKGGDRKAAAHEVLDPARHDLAVALDDLKVAGKAVTTSPESRKLLNTFRVALKRALKVTRLDVNFGLKTVKVDLVPAKKATDTDETGTDTDETGTDSGETGTDSGDSNLSVYVTEATRRDAILRALDNEAKAFVSGAVKAGMDKHKAEAEFLEAVEGWATAARDALQREAEAAKAARKGKGRRKTA